MHVEYVMVISDWLKNTRQSDQCVTYKYDQRLDSVTS